MDPRPLGLWLALLGVVVAGAGILLYTGAFESAERSGWLSWFGRLPGDIRHEGENTTVFIPITSMPSFRWRSRSS